MNQTQPIPKLRSTKQIHKQPTVSREKLPPVLFSLPDLSETCQPASPAASYSSPLTDHANVGRELPTANVARPQIQDHRPEKASNLLNAAIGFLAFAMLLIGLKLYTDRASERSRANERLLNSNAQAPSGQSTVRSPADHNQGPQRATYQTPVSTPHANPSNHSSESSNKAVLEISDPVIPASYLGEPNPPASLTPISSRLRTYQMRTYRLRARQQFRFHRYRFRHRHSQSQRLNQLPRKQLLYNQPRRPTLYCLNRPNPLAHRRSTLAI